GPSHRPQRRRRPRRPQPRPNGFPAAGPDRPGLPLPLRGTQRKCPELPAPARRRSPARSLAGLGAPRENHQALRANGGHADLPLPQLPVGHHARGSVLHGHHQHLGARGPVLPKRPRPQRAGRRVRGHPRRNQQLRISHWAGKRVGDRGRIVVVQGITVALTGIALTILALVLHHTAGISEWWMVLTLFLVGTGQGAVIGPNQTLTLADVPLNYAGSSGAVLHTAQRIGTAVGLAFITAIVFASARAINWTIGTAIGFVTIGALMGIGLLIALYDNRTRARQAE